MMLSEANLQLLQEVPLFRQVDLPLRQRLAAELQERQFKAGQLILTQGQPGGYLYILRSGKVKVHLQELCLAQLAEGDYFGEMSLFDGEPVSANVTAQTATTCLVLGREQIFQAITTEPEIGLSLLRGLSSRIRLLNQRLSGWLRGLLTLAWADQQYSPEEQQIIETLIHEELYPHANLGQLPPISGAELAELLGTEPTLAENFLRIATIVALANGTYSPEEDQRLREFCLALGQSTARLDALSPLLITDPNSPPPEPVHLQDLLQPVRQWLDDMDVRTPQTARFLCKLIPAQCPFERDIVLFGRKIVHIPPMCKLNPLYEQLVGLRFRALSYLADECHEDITAYLN
jgi:CRP-like cAMP-binding protein